MEPNKATSSYQYEPFGSSIDKKKEMFFHYGLLWLDLINDIEIVIHVLLLWYYLIITMTFYNWLLCGDYLSLRLPNDPINCSCKSSCDLHVIHSFMLSSMKKVCYYQLQQSAVTVHLLKLFWPMHLSLGHDFCSLFLPWTFGGYLFLSFTLSSIVYLSGIAQCKIMSEIFWEWWWHYPWL